MTRYIDADLFKSNLKKAMENMHYIHGMKLVDLGAILKAIDACPSADVVPKSEVEKLKIEIDALKIANEKMYSAIEATKTEVIEEYRQRVNAKMGKHTHLLGKEYVQRILREVAKEIKNEQR